MPDADRSPRDLNQSALLMLRVLEQIGEAQPVTLADLAAKLDRPKTTIHRSLATLHHAGWIRPTRDEPKAWLLTPTVLQVAHRVADHDGLRELARPILAELRDETHESTLLAVADDRMWTVVEFFEGRRPIRLAADGVVGSRYPLHAGASGKAILATFPAAALDRYIDGGLDPLTHATAHDAATLRAELAWVRTHGYAESCGETIDDDDYAGIAMAVHRPGRAAEASIAVGLPGHRLANPSTRRELIERVYAAAAALNDRIY